MPREFAKLDMPRGGVKVDRVCSKWGCRSCDAKGFVKVGIQRGRLQQLTCAGATQQLITDRN